MSTQEREILTGDGAVPISQAIQLLGIKSRSFLYKLMDDGSLRYVKLGKRRLVPRREIARLLAEHLVGA
jgi:excisionase family DNA binding protein